MRYEAVQTARVDLDVLVNIKISCSYQESNLNSSVQTESYPGSLLSGKVTHKSVHHPTTALHKNYAFSSVLDR